MGGSPISATEALAAGLVTRLVPKEQLLETALSLAHQLRDNAPIPLRLLKRHLRRVHQVDLEAVLDMEADGLMECLVSDDVGEGMRAFAEKRSPKYTGR
jgi:enoyl-CoA hydratase/carnithine racemase